MKDTPKKTKSESVELSISRQNPCTMMTPHATLTPVSRGTFSSLYGRQILPSRLPFALASRAWEGNHISTIGLHCVSNVFHIHSGVFPPLPILNRQQLLPVSGLGSGPFADHDRTSSDYLPCRAAFIAFQTVLIIC